MWGVTIPGLSPLFDSAALRDADARAIAGGIRGEVLMERAEIGRAHV